MRLAHWISRNDKLSVLVWWFRSVSACVSYRLSLVKSVCNAGYHSFCLVGSFLHWSQAYYYVFPLFSHPFSVLLKSLLFLTFPFPLNLHFLLFFFSSFFLFSFFNFAIETDVCLYTYCLNGSWSRGLYGEIGSLLIWAICDIGKTTTLMKLMIIMF